MSQRAEKESKKKSHLNAGVTAQEMNGVYNPQCGTRRMVSLLQVSYNSGFEPRPKRHIP